MRIYCDAVGFCSVAGSMGGREITAPEPSSDFGLTGLVVLKSLSVGMASMFGIRIPSLAGGGGAADGVATSTSGTFGFSAFNTGASATATAFGAMQDTTPKEVVSKKHGIH
jgi:hypothetical protein